MGKKVLSGGARRCPAERSSASQDSLTCHAERSETIRSRTVLRSRSIPTSPRFSIHGYRSFAREPSVAVGMLRLAFPFASEGEGLAQHDKYGWLRSDTGCRSQGLERA